MASIDGSRASESLSSDEQFRFECDVCKEDGQAREATSFCSECVEYYCASCVLSHKRMKATRNHSILSGTDMPKTVPAKQGYLSVMFCHCNHAGLVEFVCEDHNVVICSDCRLISHRNCTTTEIDGKFDSSIEDDMNAIIEKADDVEKKAQNIQQLYTKCHEYVSACEAKCNDKIKSFRQRLYERIDTLTQNANEELKKRIEEESKLIEIQEAQCKSSLQRLAKDKQVLQEVKNAGDKRQMFVSVFKISPVIINYHQLVDELNEKYKPTAIDFIENSLEHIQNTESSLGQFTVDGLSTKGRIPSNILNINVAMIKTKDVTPANVQRLTGSAVLSNGDIVICDCSADSLLLLEYSFKLKSSAKLSGPWDVAAFSSKEMVVTQPVAKKLQFIKIQPKPKLELGLCVDIGEECYGVDILNNEIFVSCASGDQKIRIFDIGGTLKRTFGIGTFANPFYLAVSRMSSSLFVSDYTTSETVCLSHGGRILRKYSDADLKHPRGILPDQNDNFFVCNDDEDNSVISVYKADSSKRNKTLLTCRENIKNPYCISFRESDRTLIVVCAKKILAFALQ